MATRQRLDLDTLLNDLTRAAFAVLAAWSLVGLYGTLGGYLEVNRPATLRFLFVVLILVFSHRRAGARPRAATAPARPG